MILGQYEGVLTLRGHENISFEIAENQQYGISFQDQNHAHPGTVYSGIPIATGTLQLEAQSRMYNFLASCPKKFIAAYAQDERNDVVPNQNETSDNCLPLLTHFLRLRLYGQPAVVDTNFLSVQLQTSLDKALDDLSQLRDDHGSWLVRWNETSPSAPGRTSNMLSAVFRRISIFQSLRRSIEVYYSTTKSPTDMRLLYTAVHSSLNEALGIFGNIQWSPEDNSTIFSRLISLLKANDPIIHVLHVSPIMTVIDQEIRRKRAEEVPISVMQLIDDVSVLACCLDEAFKLYNLQEHTYEDHGSEIDAYEEGWEKSGRPWMTTAAEILSAMGEQLRGKLDRRSGSDLVLRRFSEFWTNVDRYMSESCQGPDTEEVVDMIRCHPPFVGLLEKTQVQIPILRRVVLLKRLKSQLESFKLYQ